MDTVVRYREIIHRLLDDYRNWYDNPQDPGVETSIICDYEHGEYMLMRVGWRGEQRVRRPLFYLRLKAGKIWIEEDWTKDGIATELLAFRGAAPRHRARDQSPRGARPDGICHSIV